MLVNKKWAAAVEAARDFNGHEYSPGDCRPDKPCLECRGVAQLIRRQLQPLEKEIAAATGGIGKDWLDQPSTVPDLPIDPTATYTPAPSDADPISPEQIAEAERLVSKSYLTYNQGENISDLPLFLKLARLLISALRFRDRKIKLAKAECVERCEDAMREAVNLAYRDCADTAWGAACAQGAGWELRRAITEAIRRARPQAFAAEKPAPQEPEPSDAVNSLVQRERKAAALDMLRHCVAVAHEHTPYGSSIKGALERELKEMLEPKQPPGPPDPPRPKGDEPRG